MKKCIKCGAETSTLTHKRPLCVKCRKDIPKDKELLKLRAVAINDEVCKNRPEQPVKTVRDFDKYITTESVLIAYENGTHVQLDTESSEESKE